MTLQWPSPSIRAIVPEDVPPAVGGYSHGIVARGELLFVSGQTPEAADGSVPPDPEGQVRQAWANVRAVLAAAGLGVRDLVQVRTYLSDRAHRDVNTAVRREVLGSHAPALTVVICELFEPGWVVEIEAVARAAS